MKNKIILGIETSCDETSVAIVQDGKVIDELTTSSMNVQSTYGGVVPEVATRYHESNINKIFVEIMQRNNLEYSDISDIIYTKTPGLPGCLHVGTFFAKTLNNLIGANLLGVNHLYGHLFSCFINTNIEPKFPLLGLIISGGHTAIYLAHNYENIEILNQTHDDAIGEVLDKVARALDWPYPGGPIIDKNFDINKANLPLLKNNFSQSSSFSFSGLKTAALNYINNKKQKNESFDPIAIASSVQKIAIDDAISKIKYYLNLVKCETICLGGGVSANRYLREELKKLNVKNIYIPEMRYTGDQASMIAYYGYKVIESRTHQK